MFVYGLAEHSLKEAIANQYGNVASCTSWLLVMVRGLIYSEIWRRIRLSAGAGVAYWPIGKLHQYGVCTELVVPDFGHWMYIVFWYMCQVFTMVFTKVLLAGDQLWSLFGNSVEVDGLRSFAEIPILSIYQVLLFSIKGYFQLLRGLLCEEHGILSVSGIPISDFINGQWRRITWQ